MIFLIISWILLKFCCRILRIKNFGNSFFIWQQWTLAISISVDLFSSLCFRSIFSFFIHHFCPMGFFPLSEKDKQSWTKIHQPNFIEQHSWANINEPTLMDYHSRTKIYEPPFIDHNSRTTFKDYHLRTNIQGPFSMDHHTWTTNYGPLFTEHQLLTSFISHLLDSWTIIHGPPVIDHYPWTSHRPLSMEYHSFTTNRGPSVTDH
jgi:hypothetical protein